LGINKISKVENLEDLTKLQVIFLDYNKLDLNNLYKLHNVKTFYLDEEQEKYFYKNKKAFKDLPPDCKIINGLQARSARSQMEGIFSHEPRSFVGAGDQ
nr:hypothetical protein [Candidatus Sigynarchaeota archaeon]